MVRLGRLELPLTVTLPYFAGNTLICIYAL